MMIACLPTDENGEMIRKELKRLYDNMNSTDPELHVKYTLDSQTYFSQHYDFLQLIDALENFDKCFNVWVEKKIESREELEKPWQLVRDAQLAAPEYIRQHYCNPDVPFFPTPTFDGAEFNRTGACIPWLSHEQHPSELAESGTHSVEAMIRARRDIGARWAKVDTLWPHGKWRNDRFAIKKLHEVSLLDWELLNNSLSTPIYEPIASEVDYTCCIVM